MGKGGARVVRGAAGVGQSWGRYRGCWVMGGAGWRSSVKRLIKVSAGRALNLIKVTDKGI